MILDMFCFDDKVVVIIGGGCGLGVVIVLVFV